VRFTRVPRSIPSLYQLLRGSLIILPYLSYLGLIGLGIITLILAGRLWHGNRSDGNQLDENPRSALFQQPSLDPVARNGLWLLTGLLLINCLVANDRGEAFLQLTNFLPFFLFFAVVPNILKPGERLAQIALDLVIVAIPINFIALGEYILRSGFIPQPVRRIPWIDGVRDRPHAGRATVMFNHPNALASYLVIILGLGLGLMLYQGVRQRFDRPRPVGNRPTPWVHPSHTSKLLTVGTYSSLVGIFCSGSRNGLMVAVLQMVLFGLVWGLFVRVNQKVLISIFVGVMSLLGVAAWGGVGGRSLIPTTWADDPRLRLWRIALDLWRDRPWFGWGLGNYKFQFPERLLNTYPACLPERSLPVIPVECADVVHPHNFWLMMLADGGIFVSIGFTVWVGYLCVCGVNALGKKALHPSQKALLIAYLLSFISCVTFALFDVTLYDARVNALNWILLVGIYCLSQEEAGKNGGIGHWE
jgi:O-antigen ligase